MIDAILWDNDGVLVDTEELYFAATRSIFSQEGAELTRERYLEFALGNGRSMWDAFGWTADQIVTLRLSRDAAYAAMLAGGCELMDGVAEVLQRLRGTARMAVVTTSLRHHFDLAHQRNAILDFFEVVLTREDYIESKPHPEPYLTAMKRMQLAAERTLVIEDSERGLRSALAAGLRCVVIPNGFTKGGKFIGAATVLDEIRSLPALLRSF